MYVIYWEYLGTNTRVGPFETYNEAYEWANDNCYGGWTVTELVTPEAAVKLAAL